MPALDSPLPQFFDLDGSPLDGGYVYVGLIDQDPETNPIPVFWDSAMTIPAPQPLRTLNGLIARDGTPAFVYVATDHSMMILTSRHTQVLYAGKSQLFSLIQTIADMVMAEIPVSPYIATLLDDPDAPAARVTLVAAKSGANSDITSLSGLTTPLSIAQGGTGAATALAARVAIEAARGLQSIEATVAASALTLTLNPTSVEFRSSSLTNGAVISRAVAAAINLVISNGSTLGTFSGTQSRIALLAIDNAGTVELAAVNAAGGFHFDESQLISTTAEGGAGAADSANVVYSTTARSNVAWRFVGFVESTQTTAGVWATAPSKKQGAGGWAMPQRTARTWQDVSAFRTLGGTYTNTLPYDIEISVSIGLSGGSTSTLTVNGNAIANQSSGGVSENKNWNLTIPPGATYSVSTTGASISAWWELR